MIRTTENRQRIGLKELIVMVMLYTPPFVCYSMLYLTKDAALCICGSIIISFYGLPLLSEQVLKIYSFEEAGAQEPDKILKDMKRLWPLYIIGSLMVAFILASVTFLMSDGPDYIMLPIPSCNWVLTGIYWVGFGVLFVVWLPLSEEFFYRLFGMHYLNKNWAFLIISLAGTASNLAVLVHTVKGEKTIIVSSMLCFVGSICLTWLKRRTKLINTIILKSIFHFGFFLWLIYLSVSFHFEPNQKFPNRFFRTNPNNIFSY